MTGDGIFGIIMMLCISFGCGALFFGLGLWAQRSKNPFGFWTGKEVKTEFIPDIPAYNRENAKMWKIYSTPYFLSCVFSVVGIWLPGFNWFSVTLLFAACTLGIGWLIWQYKKIYRKYSIK